MCPGTVSSPKERQLDHGARVLFAAGSHTIGTILMIGVYHLLRHPEVKDEAPRHAAWLALDQAPGYEELGKQCVSFVRLEFALSMEQSPVIKEMLRIVSSTPNGPPCVVPPAIWCRDIQRRDTRRSQCTSCLSVVPEIIRITMAL